MNVKGILIEGRDGNEYLLGFARRGPDGGFRLFEDLREASRVAARQLGPRGANVIGPGWGTGLFLWSAFADALGALPTPPAWPTWSPTE
jgi:hypothetical protein